MIVLLVGFFSTFLGGQGRETNAELAGVDRLFAYEFKSDLLSSLFVNL